MRRSGSRGAPGRYRDKGSWGDEPAPGTASSTTWFITGASRGFGRELAEQLLARGDRVAATLRRPGQLDDLAGQYGDRLWVRALDVTDTGQMRRVVQQAFADLVQEQIVPSASQAPGFQAGYWLRPLEDSKGTSLEVRHGGERSGSCAGVRCWEQPGARSDRGAQRGTRGRRLGLTEGRYWQRLATAAGLAGRRPDRPTGSARRWLTQSLQKGRVPCIRSAAQSKQAGPTACSSCSRRRLCSTAPSCFAPTTDARRSV